MTSIADIRAKYPEYNDMSDGDLLMGIHRKMYPTMHPREFLNSIEGAANAHATIKNPELRQYYIEQVRKPMQGETQQDTGARLGGTSYGPVNAGRADAGARSVLQGMTAGYGDELVGRGAAMLSGNSPEFEIARERQRLQQGEEQFPVQSTVAEIGGALAVPAGAVKSVPGAVAAGTAGGMLYASGKAEEGNRLEEAAAAGPASALFSLGGVAAQRGLQGAVRGIANRVSKRPSVAGARAAKTSAYKAVDESGFKFDAPEFDDMMTRIYTRLDDPKTNYVPGDVATEGARKTMEKSWGTDMTLGELDNLRSRIWQRWASADDAQASAILNIIDEIDGLIDTKAGASPLLATAREADKTYRRLQILEDMFGKAARQTETAGSGGNIYNNYGRVFQKIIDTPKLARRFTPEQLSFFEAAIKAPADEQLMRKIGKLSPDGNGLMLMLNIIGGMADPKLLAFGGAGAMAKHASDKAMQGRVDSALRLVGSGRPAPTPQTPLALPYASSVGALSWEDKR